MRVLIFGCGNLLLSDEGFGVHFIRHLEANYRFPANVKLFDAGTMGIMVTHEIEEADRVYIVDTVAAEGEPGQLFRYTKEEIMLQRLPVKLSPHQIGIQEMLLVSEMRGRCPREITLLGVVAATMEAGNQLHPLLQHRRDELAAMLVNELLSLGISVHRRNTLRASPSCRAGAAGAQSTRRENDSNFD